MSVIKLKVVGDPHYFSRKVLFMNNTVEKSSLIFDHRNTDYVLVNLSY